MIRDQGMGGYAQVRLILYPQKVKFPEFPHFEPFLSQFCPYLSKFHLLYLLFNSLLLFYLSLMHIRSYVYYLVFVHFSIYLPTIA